MKGGLFMRSLLGLALSPILLVNCVGDSSVPVDAGSDASTQDTTAPDTSTNDGTTQDVANEAEAGIPLTGSFSNVLVLPDTTGAFPAIDFASNGDVLFGGILSDISGTVLINGYGYVSAGGNDVLVIKLAANN